jgi:hypothetical protein
MKVGKHTVLVGRRRKGQSKQDAATALVGRKSGAERVWAGQAVGPIVVAISGPKVDAAAPSDYPTV